MQRERGVTRKKQRQLPLQLTLSLLVTMLLQLPPPPQLLLLQLLPPAGCCITNTCLGSGHLNLAIVDLQQQHQQSKQMSTQQNE
jgi:hypothetical protein